MKHKKMLCLYAFFLFFCANLRSGDIDCEKIEEVHRADGQSVGKCHFKDCHSIVYTNCGLRIRTRTKGLFVHKDEVRRPLSEMRIGLSFDGTQVEYIIPTDDPLRGDSSLWACLNAFVACRYEDEEARKRLCELVSQGVPLSSFYSITAVWGRETSEFLLVKEFNYREGFFPDVPDDGLVNFEHRRKILRTVFRARSARHTVLRDALSDGGLYLDLIRLIIWGFDENSGEELKEIKRESKKKS